MKSQMISKVREFLGRMESRQEKGQGLIEYALIILLVSIVVIIVLGLLGDQIKSVFTAITSTLGTI
jgi:pilus assembly protein Flp/PilA